jgi:hypothetical protein
MLPPSPDKTTPDKTTQLQKEYRVKNSSSFTLNNIAYFRSGVAYYRRLFCSFVFPQAESPQWIFLASAVGHHSQWRIVFTLTKQAGFSVVTAWGKKNVHSDSVGTLESNAGGCDN